MKVLVAQASSLCEEHFHSSESNVILEAITKPYSLKICHSERREEFSIFK
jgi:hypothetical protein